MRDRFRVIARVQKAHGRRGEVVTVPVHGLPSVVREGLSVAVVPPPLRGERWHEVVSVSGDSRSGSLVALSGVTTIEDAEALVGAHLIARAEDLPDPERLVGRVVRDARDGAVGVIEEVMTGPANDVWVVRGERGELLVPVVDAVVREVAPEGEIAVTPPQGLAWEPRGAGQ